MNRSEDRLGHAYEHVFHLTKSDKYHYNADVVLQPAKPAKLDNIEPATATGLTLERCLKRIKTASALSDDEKSNVERALDDLFADIEAGKLNDFRMVLRGENRTTHSEDEQISARAGRLKTDGYYFLRYDPRGSLPRDVWNISPERSKGRDTHYAAYPTNLCTIPITATCPQGGIVLDPFVGTGTTLVAANKFGYHGIGIDRSQEYLNIATSRLDGE